MKLTKSAPGQSEIAAYAAYARTFGKVEVLAALCVEQALNDIGPCASGETVCAPMRRWSRVVSEKAVQRVVVRTDAFIVASERNSQRFRRNASYSTSRSGCRRSIRRSTGDAFASCRENRAELTAHPDTVLARYGRRG
jgi:hypothetical protein